MELPILNIQGKDSGKSVTLPDEIFGIEANDHAIYLDVRNIRAHGRQGTHKAKERGEVSGSTKKPFRQKGTGGARQGHKRAPHMYHGGRVFGPRPHDYGFVLNKKVKVLARKSALTYKAKDNAITVLESFNFEGPKTKSLIALLQNINAGDRKVLIVLPEQNKNIYLSGRNLPFTKVMTAADLNTYDILDAEQLVLVHEAIPVISRNFGMEDGI
jgi:large subunit ribosomal protein L4